MRFLRRVEGIRSARVVFKRARDDERISYHVFVATAFMEYFCTKDKTIAYKIFQLGCKRFGHLPEYIMAFIEFVTHMNGNLELNLRFIKVYLLVYEIRG
jgi:cleavage stimulation factor subunit 3